MLKSPIVSALMLFRSNRAVWRENTGTWAAAPVANTRKFEARPKSRLPSKSRGYEKVVVLSSTYDNVRDMWFNVTLFGLALVAAAAGGVASMVALQVFHDWAYKTEFSFHIRTTVQHSVLLFLVLWLWFKAFQPRLTTHRGMLTSLGAILVGGLASGLLGIQGIIWILSGQAFIASAVATVVFVPLASAWLRKE